MTAVVAFLFRCRNLSALALKSQNPTVYPVQVRVYCRARVRVRVSLGIPGGLPVLLPSFIVKLVWVIDSICILLSNLNYQLAVNRSTA